MLAVVCRQHRCEKQAAILQDAAGLAGTPIPHSASASCAHLMHTVCAARALMQVDPFAFLRVCVAGRAQLAGLESKNDLPALLVQ